MLSAPDLAARLPGRLFGRLWRNARPAASILSCFGAGQMPSRGMFQHLFSFTALVLAAAPSAVVAQNSAPALATMERAGAAAHGAFSVTDAGGLQHIESGFTCPPQSGGLLLSGNGVGPLPGQPGASPAYCEYADSEGPVVRVAFAQDAPSAPVLGADFCKKLTKRMKLRLGAGALPGNNRIEGPAQPSTLPTLPLKGEAVPLWRCTHIREPYQSPIIVFDAAAVRSANGWTILAVHTPRPPRCCSADHGPVDFTFFVRPLAVIGQIVEAPPETFPATIAGLESLRPGRGARQR